jgi:hypothetical protein
MKFIDKAFLDWMQSVIDFTQKQPHEMCRLFAYGIGASSLVRAYLNFEPWMATLDAVMTVLYVSVSRSRVWVASMGEADYFRFFMLLLAIFSTISTAIHGGRVATLLQAWCLALFFYAAACRPPKPPLPKGKLGLST